MKLELPCEKAKYNGDMQVICRETGMGCAHQTYKSCKGWWVMTEDYILCKRRANDETTGGRVAGGAVPQEPRS